MDKLCSSITSNLNREDSVADVLDLAPVGVYRATPDGQILRVNFTLVKILRYPDRESLLARSLRDLYEERVECSERYAVLPESPGGRCFESRLRCFDGTRVLARETVWTVHNSVGDPIFYDGFVEDVTAHRKAEEDAERRAACLKALCQVGMGLTAELDLEALLQAIVAEAIRLLGATSGGLHLYRPDRDVLEWTTVVGPNKPPPGVILSKGQGLAGRVWESGEPIIVDDYPRWQGRAQPYEGYPWTAVVGVPVRWREEFLGVLDVVAEPPRRFTPDDAELLSLFAAHAAIAIRNARVLATLEEQRRRAEALARATASLTSALDLEKLAENVLNAVREAIPTADRGYLLVDCSDDSSDSPVCVAFGYDNSLQEPAQSARENAIARWSCTLQEPMLIHDVQTELWQDRRVPETVRSAQSAIVAPLRCGEQITGFMVLESIRRKGAFTETDLTFVAAFADQVAIAVENARLFQQVRRQHAQIRALAARLSEAEELERQRLSRELHDQVGQSLTALGIHLNVLRSALQTSASDAIAGRLDDSILLVQEIAQRVRELMADLRPPVLDDYGLVAALKWYAGQVSRLTGLCVVVNGEEPVPRLDTKVETALFRIAQEALNNAIRHSRAHQVSVLVDEDNHVVRLVVADDGIGFNANEVCKSADLSGWGLLTMRERAQAVGGIFTVRSSPRHGTQVVVEVVR